MSISLSESQAVKLDGSGNGTLSIGPLGPNEHWLIDSVAVKCSTAVLESTCKFYVGYKVSDDTFAGVTYSGSSGDTGTGNYDLSLRTDPKLFAVWTGGDVGATATINLYGTKEFR